MFENGFRTITDYVIHLWSWNFIHLLPMSQGCALLILGSKGQRSRSWIIDVWKWFPDHNWLCNPYKFGVGSGLELEVTECCRNILPIQFLFIIIFWKWFPDDNWLCNQPMIMKLHTLTPHEFVGVGGGPVLLNCIASAILSVCFYMLPLYVAPLVWKWFPDDNWLCNQPMIMKLHPLTHHESRMRPIDFEVKRSKVKVMD